MKAVNMFKLISGVACLVLLTVSVQAADLEGGWILRESPMRAMMYSADFANDNVGWTVGLNGINQTVNGGKTWIARYQPIAGKDYWFNSVAGLDDRSALVAGYPYANKNPDEPGVILRTDNQGVSWQRVDCGSQGSRYSSLIFRSNKRIGYVLTDRDGLMKTINGGRTWQKIDIGVNQPRTMMTQHPIISLPDGRTVIVAANGALAVSRNDGRTWQKFPFPENVKRPAGYLITWICFPTANEGWVSLYAGDVIHTRDGGKTWDIQDDRSKLWHEKGRSLWKTTQYTVSRSNDMGKNWDAPLRIGGGNDAIHQMTFTDQRAYVTGGSEGHGHPFIADRSLADEVGNNNLPLGVVPIRIDVPDDGVVTIQILDEQNNLVRNLISGVHLPKGKQTIEWNLATESDFWPPFEKNKDYLYDPPANAKFRAEPGTYRWRGLFHTPLSASYRFSYYPLKNEGMPWITEDQTGGWLADHVPPQCIVARTDGMWLGTFAESGDSLLQADTQMRKLWGGNRFDVTMPRALASDGDYIYFIEANGWNKGLRLVQLHHQTKAFRILCKHELPKGDPIDIAGLAVQDNMAYVTFRDGNQMLVIDLSPNLQSKDQTMHIVAKIPVKQAGNVRPYGPGQLAVVMDRTVSLLNTSTRKFSPVVFGLKNPFGLGIDKQGNFYVGEMAPLHQVHVFNPRGRSIRVIGKPGGHPVGPFDKQHLENPRGVSVDTQGNVWVVEDNPELKRTSVWDQQGRCVNQVLGPTVYGGGGSIDQEDGNRLFYRGKEFHRDPDTGKIELINIIWRMDDPSVDEFAGHRDHNFGGNAPSMPFHKNGKLWFRLWGASGMGELAVLFVYDKNRARPVSAVGKTPKWINERFGSDDSQHHAFAWTDSNDDGKVQRHELQFGPVAGSAGWGVRMNENFQVAFSNITGNVGFCFFEPRAFNALGYPVYDLPEKFHHVENFNIHDPSNVQGMMTDAKGNAIAISPYIVSMSPQGKVNWRYICRWPGLHAGLATTAVGIEPGVFIAPLRFYGSVMTTPDIGEVFCIGTNYGVTHLMTTDGMYIDRFFGDSRRSDAWKFNESPTPEQIQQVSLGQEHFGGSFQKVRMADGKDHDLYVVSPGSVHCSVVELHGLDTLKRLEGESFNVTAEHVLLAQKMRQEQVRSKLVPKEYTISKLKDFVADTKDQEWPRDQINGFKLGYDQTHLYVYYHERDDKAVFANAATRSNFAECFKSGDVVDLMLQTDTNAPADRMQAAQGDIRLSLTMLDGEPAAVLYDYVVSGTPEHRAISFSSPWRSVRVDEAKILDDAQVNVTRQQDYFILEASIPLASLHLKPHSGLKLRGDVGRVLSDQTGTTRIDRIYWSNPDTRVVSDIPSETQLQPNLWGTFIFE